MNGGYPESVAKCGEKLASVQEVGMKKRFPKGRQFESHKSSTAKQRTAAF